MEQKRDKCSEGVQVLVLDVSEIQEEKATSIFCSLHKLKILYEKRWTKQLKKLKLIARHIYSHSWIV